LIDGDYPLQGNVRLMLPTLMRLAVARPELRTWLKNVTAMPEGHALAELETSWAAYRSQEQAKRHRAEHYRRILKELSDAKEPARALSLYQLLSSAYVAGSQLPDFQTCQTKKDRGEPQGKLRSNSCYIV
jgi:hypothetical protein